ncbi:putative transposase [Sulfurimonas gotlandica GD1]|uniref:Putative transposase n=1 Tax=Sulfurimonas gotlandica (strain DSM 19862 / JCM 16533 / GD1) TaxID=929558 RepID=B6BL71_SULGG|nr:transposase [Sulfurimonas gotlandica GD1]EHP28810.1 putative transposase [Sulfurimonas gotlandica GD1]
MQVHRSGYYQWLNQPISDRELENKELLIQIKDAFKASNSVYGHRNIHKDLKELGIHVNKKRVARLMSEAKLYGVGTYKRKPYSKPGPAHKAYPNSISTSVLYQLSLMTHG